MEWFTRTITAVLGAMFYPTNDGYDEKSSDSDAPALFQSLVDRSIEAWKSLNYVGRDQAEAITRWTRILRNIKSLEALLESSKLFWFFQLKESFVQQKLLGKWNSDSLDAYILLPLEHGFANNQDCFFISHYWNTPEHPDPQGHDMRLFLEDIGQTEWSYVWVDWTCMPQSPRTEAESYYFKNMLQFIPTLVRDCAFEWRFPSFAPRAWILFEIAEYVFTHSGGIAITEDITPFISHVIELVQEGVRPTLSKYGYTCTNNSDILYVIGWLEVLVILVKIFPDVGMRQQILDSLDTDNVGIFRLTPIGLGIDKRRGIITEQDGTEHRFTPIPGTH
ncbi:hypothetical protein BDZ94DRAFT_1275255 [Collybia nuda]|uniref:Heterokaryon incompatibility domain-containing protein n=1 Tax=Collybia nuda TaxID=64659 RepID=A0A9P5XTJ9_9AGAR|nr:hypothetical protein BDZ94DRAFT_1275255 [Collybia nuda]